MLGRMLTCILCAITIGLSEVRAKDFPANPNTAVQIPASDLVICRTTITVDRPDQNFETMMDASQTFVGYRVVLTKSIYSFPNCSIGTILSGVGISASHLVEHQAPRMLDIVVREWKVGEITFELTKGDAKFTTSTTFTLVIIGYGR